MNKVELFVNGKIYTGWIEVSISRAINAVAGSFDISVSNNWADETKGWIISPLDECIIKIDGQEIITGFVDQISSSFDGNSRTIRISGRDKTGNLVDCSYVGPASINNVSIASLINKVIEKFGLTFVSEINLPTKVDDFKVQQGESVFTFLERVLRVRGLMLSSNPNGELVVSKIGEKRSSSSLEEGVNVLTCSFDFNGSNRFSKYIVKGQSSGNDEFEESETNQVFATFDDNEVKQYRPLIIIAEGNVSNASALTRAKWECINRASKSSVLKVSVKGWKKENGDLWAVNEIVNFKSKYFGFDIDLLISSINYKQDSQNGTICEMTLERPDSYSTYDKPAKKTRDVWTELSPWLSK